MAQWRLSFKRPDCDELYQGTGDADTVVANLHRMMADPDGPRTFLVQEEVHVVMTEQDVAEDYADPVKARIATDWWGRVR